MGRKFTFLEHTADIKFQVFGKTPAEIFENSTAALSSYMSSGKALRPKLMMAIDVESDNYENLLYKFLDELLYLVDAESFVPCKAEVTLQGMKIHAIIYGDDTKKHELMHVKAATYAEMYLKKTMNGWEAQVVLDV